MWWNNCPRLLERNGVISSHKREVLIMSNRRKYEGEEELQLQLLEVTQDPAFDKDAPQYIKMLIVRDKAELDQADEVQPQTAKTVH
jgi:hypothetical protein